MTALAQLMQDHQLRDEQVAIMLSVSAYTVGMWRKGRRDMPNNLMELLTIKLQAAASGNHNLRRMK